MNVYVAYERLSNDGITICQKRKVWLDLTCRHRRRWISTDRLGCEAALLILCFDLAAVTGASSSLVCEHASRASVHVSSYDGHASLLLVIPRKVVGAFLDLAFAVVAKDVFRAIHLVNARCWVTDVLGTKRVSLRMR